MPTTMKPGDIARSIMDTADRIWWNNRQSDSADYITLSEALPADLLAHVRAELAPKSEAEALELAEIVALRVQFTNACDLADCRRHWLWQQAQTMRKGDLREYAARMGVAVSGWDTKAEILETMKQKLYPRTTWDRFVETATAA